MLQAARSQGLVARSPLLSGALVLATMTTLIIWVGSGVGVAIRKMAGEAFTSLGELPAAALGRTSSVGSVMLPALVALAAASLLSALLQVGPMLAPGALVPSTRGLSAGQMAATLRRSLAPSRVVMLALTLVIAIAVGAAVIVPLLPSAAHLAQRDAAVLGAFLSAAAVRLAWWLAAAMLCVGALDFLLRRRQHKRSLWRTRQEADRERREEEGDSTHAAARRRLHDELSHAAALDAAKSARLVIAGKGNAIALAYDAGVDPAPRALVCGRGWHALTVMRLAEEAGVAIADDATLAVELIETPPGGFIPESTYPPVAEWLRRTERGS